MQQLIIIIYLLATYFLLPYAFSMLGAIRKVGAISQEEAQQDSDNLGTLTTDELNRVKKLSTTTFMVLAILLLLFVGMTYGLIANHSLEGRSWQGVGYALLYLVMISSFRIGKRVLETNYTVVLNLKEQLFFFAALLLSYGGTIWQEAAIPAWLKWHWIF